MVVGQSQLFTATASGGSGDLTYQWYLNGNTAGTNSSSYSFAADSGDAGSVWVYVTATDSATIPLITTSNTATVTVNSALAITASSGSDGAITPAGIVSVNYGGSQSFTITANTGYYIVDVSVNGSSVGAVSSYTLSNVQAAYTISATFAQTSTPSSSPTTTPNPVPTPTPISTATPIPTTAPTSTPIPTTSPKQTLSQSLPQEIIYGVAFAVVIVAIGGAVPLLRKSKKGKS
jgi:hypothetical protein